MFFPDFLFNIFSVSKESTYIILWGYSAVTWYIFNVFLSLHAKNLHFMLFFLGIFLWMYPYFFILYNTILNVIKFTDKFWQKRASYILFYMHKVWLYFHYISETIVQEFFFFPCVWCNQMLESHICESLNQWLLNFDIGMIKLNWTMYVYIKFHALLIFWKLSFLLTLKVWNLFLWWQMISKVS